MFTETAGWVGIALSGGRYQVAAKLGEGGMGYVYRAHDRNLDCDVVIKVPRRAMLEDAEFAGRFAGEIRSLVQLVHPHIVKVTDVGDHDGHPFAVLQYLSGGSLRDRQRKDAEGRPLPMAPEETRPWLEGVAEALDFIHGQQFIHRDVKPENILFDAHGHAYLSDFGVAKVLAGKAEGKPKTVMTETGLVLGTPQYMAPELLLGQPYDGRIDQYALAVMVYELLSGRYPFDGPTSTAVFVQQTTQEPPRLETVVPSVPREVAAAVHKALAKEPGQRFPDCRTFARAVLAGFTEASAPAGKAAVPKGPVTAVAGKVTCPGCRKVVALPAAALGKRVRCPACGETFQAPGPPQALPAAKPRPASETGRAEVARADTGSVARPVPPSQTGSAAKSNPPAPQPAPGPAEASPLAELNLSAGKRTDPARPKKAQPPPTGFRRYWPWLAGAAGLLVLGVVVLFGYVLSGETKRDEVAVQDTKTNADSEKSQSTHTAEPTAPQEPSRSVTPPSVSPTANVPESQVKNDPEAEVAKEGPVGEVLQYKGFPGGIWCVAISSDGGQVCGGGGDSPNRKSVSGDYDIHVWDLKTGKEQRRLMGHTKTVRCLAYCPGRRRLASASWDQTVRLWDTDSGREIHCLTGHINEVGAVAFSPDGKELASGAVDKTVRFWDPDSGRLLRQYEGPDEVHCLAYSPDGRHLIAGTRSGMAILLDVATCKEIRRFTGHNDLIHSITFSRDGKQILSGHGQGTTVLWDVAGDREVASFLGHAVCFSADGRRALIGCNNKTVQLWDVSSWRQVDVFSGHGDFVQGVAFTPDGRFGLSGSWDGTARLWRLPDEPASSNPVGQLVKPTEPVSPPEDKPTPPPENPPTEESPKKTNPRREVLFDGKDLSGWRQRGADLPPQWKVKNGYLEVVPKTGDIQTRKEFPGDYMLYVQFWLPSLPKNIQGQARANSGVFLQGRYEIQILDSSLLGKKRPTAGDCGALFGQHAPLINACRPPGEWQTFDITFRAPRFDARGKVAEKARVTVWQNKQLILHNVEIRGPSAGAISKAEGPSGPLLLQEHGSAVRFGHIWIEPLEMK
jgi:serine/threonine-protein kinase